MDDLRTALYQKNKRISELNKQIDRQNKRIAKQNERMAKLERLARDLFADLDNAIHSCPRKRTLSKYEKIMHDLGIEVRQ